MVNVTERVIRVTGLGDRLRALRDRAGWNQEDLGAKAGVSHSQVSNWENNKGRIDDQKLLAVADALSERLGKRITTDYLLGRSTNEDDSLPPISFPGMTIRLPVFGAIAAGEPTLAEQNIEGWEEVPVAEIRDGEYFFLTVRGDSMSGARILDGDKVFVRRQPTVENGEIAVVMVNGEDATLKTVYQNGSEIMLIPENPDYGRISVKAQEARILGKVIWVRHDPNRRTQIGNGAPREEK